MRKIYESHVQERVGHYQSILEEAGIPTLVKNEFACAADGLVLTDPIVPELWVVEDEDHEKAIGILRPYHESRSA